MQVLTAAKCCLEQPLHCFPQCSQHPTGLSSINLLRRCCLTWKPQDVQQKGSMQLRDPLPSARPHSLPSSCLGEDRAGLWTGRPSPGSLYTCSQPGAWTSLPGVSRRTVRKGVQRGSKQAVRDWLEIRAQTVIALWFRRWMRAAPYQTTETFAPSDREMESRHTLCSRPPLAALRTRLLPVLNLLTGQDLGC